MDTEDSNFAEDTTNTVIATYTSAVASNVDTNTTINTTTDETSGQVQARAVNYHIKNLEKLHIGNQYTFNVNDGNQLPAIFQGLDAGSTTTSSQPKCCQIENANGVALCDKFQQDLQHFYGNLILPKIAWLEDKAQDLPIQRMFVRLELAESNKPIEIEEIFNKINDEQPMRILIEGQPGYGKTTLAQKLAYDWAKQKNYIKHFKFVLLLSLRTLQGCSIEETVKSFGEILNLDEEYNAMKILNTHQKDTLFLLDGLDELNTTDRRSVLKMLYGKRYSAIVFNRSGLFTLKRKERLEIFKGVYKPNDFHDKYISILGIQSFEDKKMFLQNVFPEKSEQDIDIMIKNVSLQLDLFDSPLFLMLLTVIEDLDMCVQKLSTKTELYKKLFNYIIKHSYVKSGQFIDSNFDLFTFGTSNTINELSNIQQLIYQFGKLSLSNIVKFNLQFECSELTDKIFKAGFLIHHKNNLRYETKYHYEAFHLSFLEFVAAFYLWVEFKTNKTNFSEGLTKPITKHFIETEGLSLVLPFLASLMEDDLDYLLINILPIAFIFRLDFNLMLKLIEHCESINKKSLYLYNFIPSEINLCDFWKHENIEIYKQLLEYGSELNAIKQITIDLKSVKTSRDLCNNIKIDTCLRIKKSAFPGQLFSNKNILSLIPANRYIYSEEYLNLITLPNIESCTLCLCGNEMKYLKLIAEEEKFKTIKFRSLEMYAVNSESKKYIIKLLERNQVQFLKFQRPGLWSNVSDICYAAGKSTYLTCVDLAYVTVNLDHLFNNGVKKYDYARFCGCSFISQPLQFNNCDFMCIDSDVEEEMITLEPTTLKISNYALKKLINAYPDWIGFISVKHLILEHLPQFMQHLCLFENIQTIEIEFNDEDANQALELLKNLPITTLVIDPIKFNSDLFELINNFWSNVQCLKTIHLVLTGINISTNMTSICTSQIRKVIKAIENKQWCTVKLFAHPGDISIFKRTLFQDFDLDLYKFNVIHHSYGFNIDDPLYYKILSKDNDYDGVCVVSITNQTCNK